MFNYWVGPGVRASAAVVKRTPGTIREDKSTSTRYTQLIHATHATVCPQIGIKAEFHSHNIFAHLFQRFDKIFLAVQRVYVSRLRCLRPCAKADQFSAKLIIGVLVIESIQLPVHFSCWVLRSC